MAGLGGIFSYHFVPMFAVDAGAGLSLTGLRIGARARVNFLTGEWTPFLAAGFSYAAGSGDQDLDGEARGEKFKYRVSGSPFAQLAGGVNYTGREGFVFAATGGYSRLLKKENAQYVSGSVDGFKDVQALVKGGVLVAVAFGYAF